jgi:hypothetical protein
MIILRSKNEILIIKEYFSDLNIIFIFFPIVLIFSIFEINKDISSNYINNLKSDFLKSDEIHYSKIFIENGDEKRIYTVLKGLNIHEFSIDEINTYHILKDQIVYAEYSDDISIINNNVVANRSTYFNENEAFISSDMNMVLKNLDKYLTNQQIFYLKDHKIKLEINSLFLLKLLCLILFFHSLFLMLLSRKVIDKKYNIAGSIIICLTLVIYFLVINMIVIHTLSNEIFILTFFLMSLIFIKYLKYE